MISENHISKQYAEAEINSAASEHDADTADMASENSSSANNQGKVKKPYDKVQSKISRELLKWVIKAVGAILKRYKKYHRGLEKKYTKEEFEYYLNLTPYSSLLEDGENDDEASHALILRAVISCLFMSNEVMGDEMHSNLFTRSLCGFEHRCQVDVDGVLTELIDFQVVISDSISGFTLTHYNYLKGLYPDVNQDGRLVKRAISNVILIACRISGKFNVHLCSDGSKIGIMKKFHFENIRYRGTGARILIDLMARSASVALYSMAFFDKVYCGDKDKAFSNFFETLCDYPVAICLRVIFVLTNQGVLTIGNGNCNISWKKAEHLFNNAKIDLETTFADKKSPSNAVDKINAAANLLFKINLSHFGYGQKFDKSCADKFLRKLESIFADLIYTSTVLHDSVIKATYIEKCNGLAYVTPDKNKATTAKEISVCPVIYTNWDFSKGLNKVKDNENATVIIDSPFLMQFLFPCNDYSEPFTLKDMRRLLKPFKQGCKCKAILFHSDNVDVESVVIAAGFRKVDTYTSNGYTTVIYSYNIGSDENFFIP